uniref:p0047B08.8 protein n=1 Tax=Oryza sativa subsp. japonica TaxID=39947 RepID=Q94JA3_ORYSJ|nr:P0047B08.8 [Oryza sativa Japonica Group]
MAGDKTAAPPPPDAAAFSPDGELFAAVSDRRVQVSDGETDEEDAVPPIIYEDKDTDDEESEVDAMETDEESQELGDVTDASEHSDGSDIMTD